MPILSRAGTRSQTPANLFAATSSAVALSRSGTVFTSRSPRARASESARGSATREATLRCGEPIQLRRAQQLRRADATSIVGKDFLPAIALEEPVVGQGHGRFAITGRYSCATDLPDVSKCFRRDSSRHPCQRPPCYFAWGCFRYFGWKRETGLSRARHEPAIGATKSTRLVGLRRSLASILACLSARTRRQDR